MSENNNDRVWFITGATSGTGLALAELLLTKGDKVIGTSRDYKKFESLPTLLSNPNFLGLQVDIQSEASLQSAVTNSIGKFGSVDVIVNNAGQGSLGALEEISNDQVREAMENNYFGPLKVIKAFLPYLRAKKSGYIVNVASNVAITGLPRLGAYSAAKAALTNFSESLALDVKDFNIKVSVVILGLFDTPFGKNSQKSDNFLPEYDSFNTLMNNLKEYAKFLTPGDPKKYAALMYEISNQPNPPLHIIVGADSVHSIESRDKLYKEEISTQEKASQVSIDTKWEPKF